MRWRPRSLPVFWKLLLPFGGLIVVVGAVAAFLVVRNDATRTQTALTQDLQEASLRTRGQLQSVELRLLESANLAANLTGMAAAVESGDAAAATDLLRSVVALRPELVGVGVQAAGGGVVATLGAGGDELPDLWAAAPVADALVAASGERRSGIERVGGRTLLVVAAPVCRGVAPCDAVGVAVVARDLEAELNDLAAGSAEPVGLALFDDGGSLLARRGTTPGTLPADVRPSTALVRIADELAGDEVQTLYAPLVLQGQPQGVVAVTLPAAPAFEAVRANGRGLVAVLVAALLGIAGVGALVTRGILRQVYPLVEVNERLGSGDLGARVPVLTEDEIGQVAHGLNDMAERLQASHETLESRVDQRTAEVERLLRQRTEFFASLSHELRTPLAIVLGQAELLLLGDDDETRQAGRAIHQSAAQLLGLVSEILELARAEAGTLEVEPRTVRLEHFLDELRPTLDGLARLGDLQLQVDVAPRLPAVLVDPDRLREIVINLTDNAVKYSPTGSTVVVEAVVASATEVAVSVSDEGRGIPPDAGSVIFEPFARVGEAPRTGGSSGLGLALTRQLVRAHGGDIDYRSELGLGTTFTFTLPIVDGQSPRPAATASLSEGSR